MTQLKGLVSCMVLQAHQHGTTSCLKKRDILKCEFLLLRCHNSQEHTHARSDNQGWVGTTFDALSCTYQPLTQDMQQPSLPAIICHSIADECVLY